MITQIWQGIDEYICKNNMQDSSNLRGGVDIEFIENVEKQIGYVFPKNFVTYLTLHNGTHNRFIDGWQFLSIEEIVVEWKVQNQVLQSLLDEASDDLIEEGVWWWIPSWIPWTRDGLGNHLCIDCTENSDGFGRIIYFDHELYSEIIAPNFTSLMEKFMLDLKDGKYIFEEKGQLISESFLFTQPIDTVQQSNIIYSVPFRSTSSEQ